MKYFMEEATIIMRGHLGSVTASRPLGVYAIACRLRLETEAAIAAKHTLRMHSARG